MRIRVLRHLLVIAATAMLLAAAGEGLAQPTTVPTDIGPYDRYRLAFVTSDVRMASSSNIADYNDFVAGVAATVPELVALGTTWKAIVSTAADAARDNTGTAPSSPDDVPIYLLNDTLLATGNADLWDGTIAVPFDIRETGSPPLPCCPCDGVWTGTASNGVQSEGPLVEVQFPTVGHICATHAWWIEMGPVSPWDTYYSIYALSGVLGPTSPIPALPHWTHTVLLVTLLAITGWRVRKVVGARGGGFARGSGEAARWRHRKR